MATTGSDDAITFVISVAAELAGMHPQTLRQYDRLGLVIPARTKGRGRRYTKRDVQRLRDVQRMSQEEGINLAGIRRILELERRVEALEDERDALRGAVAAAEAKRNRVFAASADGQVMPMRRGQRPWIAPRGLRLALAALSPCGIRYGHSRLSPPPRPRRVLRFRLRRDRRRAR